MPDPFSMTAHEFADAMRRTEGGDRRAHLQTYRSLYRNTGGTHPHTPGEPARTMVSESPEGPVTKFLLRVPRNLDNPRLAARLESIDTLETESVIIPMLGRSGRLTHTLCVSSQVGCAMGCGFCETAQMGLIRHLTPREIVAQWYAARHHLQHEISNIVFMGMGEPLDNADTVIRAIEILTDPRGPAIPMSRITVSTVGRIDGLDRLGALQQREGWKGLRVAISLNAPNDEVRSAIMPINASMPMSELRDCLLRHPRLGGKKLCIEYVLIPDVNDGPEHAAQLADFLRPINEADPRNNPRLMVNVIPYNPRRDSPWPAPSENQTNGFIDDLIGHGLFVKRRRTKGRDTMAACGQLGNERIRRRRVVQPTIAGR